MTETQAQSPPAPVSDPNNLVQPSTGVVRPHVEQTTDGVLDPTFWEGLDARTQGEVAESLPQVPPKEGEYEYLMATEGNPEGPQISALTVGDITATGATVTWTTDEPGVSRVVYGTEANSFPDGTSWSGEQATSHSVSLSGLTAGTTYYIEAHSRDADGNMMGAQTQFATLTA